MSLSLAIANLETALSGVTGTVLVSEGRAPGSKPFSLTLADDGLERLHHFGAVRKVKKLSLALSVKGTTFDIASIADKQDAVISAVIADRRRGANAQTTIVGEWTKSEDTGREGMTFTLPIEIHVLA